MRRFGMLLFGVMALMLSARAGYAVEPDERLADPALEARARVLGAELRCLVCQNTSIDESNAPLAHDLRVLLRQRLKAGDSDAQVLNFMVARYGQFVLLKPMFTPTTYLLWLGPPVLLLGGLGLLLLRARHRAAPVPPLSEAERRRAERLLDPSGNEASQP